MPGGVAAFKQRFSMATTPATLGTHFDVPFVLLHGADGLTCQQSKARSWPGGWY